MMCQKEKLNTVKEKACQKSTILTASLKVCRLAEELARESESPLKMTESSQGAGRDAKLWTKVQQIVAQDEHS